MKIICLLFILIVVYFILYTVNAANNIVELEYQKVSVDKLDVLGKLELLLKKFKKRIGSENLVAKIDSVFLVLM